MKIFLVLILLLGLSEAKGQSLDRIVEDYIRKNNVVTISDGDTTFRKTGKPYLKKHSSGVRSLTVPKGAISIPMPTGVNDIRGKLYTSFVSSNVEITLSVVQVINGKEAVVAAKGGDIVKGRRSRVDILVDYSNYQKATIYCYFLNGVVFGTPFVIPKDHVAKLSNFELGSASLDQDVPALLIYEEEKSSVKREKLVEEMKIGEYLSLNRKKQRNIYKQLGNYCIVYYRLTKK